MRNDKDQLAWLILGVFLGIAIAALAFILADRTRPAAIYITPPAPTVTPLPTATPGPIRVYITGEVLHPAVYELPAGAILQDVVLAAGGFSENANRDAINLAIPLNDGLHVHVPDLSQETALPLGSGGVVPSTSSTSQLININTATIEELDRLPGIGPSIAQRIIEYREQNGPFFSVEELLNVSGIGPAKLEQMKDLITIE